MILKKKSETKFSKIDQKKCRICTQHTHVRQVLSANIHHSDNALYRGNGCLPYIKVYGGIASKGPDRNTQDQENDTLMSPKQYGVFASRILKDKIG